EIKLNDALRLNSCKELFEDKDYLLHTVSLIPYSVFVNKQNYSGHTPKLIKSEFLMNYVYENFINEFRSLDKSKEVLLIPLGKAVQDVLLKLSEDNLVDKNQILLGFPHPSGANVNRIKQLEENKDYLKASISSKFKSI
ncbi:MAG: hypothetical protein E7J33_03205, partial [Peptostreptococcaceae bacterium]|nr:hypothetical protein [Peptostreptococcaceae bacterium]